VGGSAAQEKNLFAGKALDPDIFDAATGLYRQTDSAKCRTNPSESKRRTGGGAIASI
jgi:hypothetical protein